MSFASGHRGVPVCPIDWSKSSGSSRVRYIFLQTYLDVYKQSDKNRQRGQLKFIKVNQSSSRSTNMAQLALHALTGFLSLVYIAMGVVKLYPVSQQMAFAVQFRCMLYASVFPSAWLGYTPDDGLYRILTGMFELSCGLAMLSWDRELRLGGCGVLVAIMALMVWSGLALGDYFFVFFYVAGLLLLSFVFVKFWKQKQD
ncbi:uncharacterized protein LOC110452295 isoform X2 [Mizuhopecten yessoensis]|uniref:uncharacterized protein LOC110452295 isoform X2 n=1 Tax=Mizuhopecten yessoensis TaxID=6573 RepID=UPI000B457A90|nr:uncharacterized protein LOC110452295 isoform X2 [Mizuhopecten yessoensis]